MNTQKFIYQRTFLYELTDYLQAQKDKALILLHEPHQSTKHHIQTTFHLALIEELQYRLTTYALDNNLPPYIHQGHYQVSLAINQMSDTQTEQGLNELIRQFFAYCLAKHKQCQRLANTPSIPHFKKIGHKVQKEKIDALLTFLYAQIKTIQSLYHIIENLTPPPALSS